MRQVNQQWLKQYNSIKHRFNLAQRLWHRVMPPLMQDPNTERIYSKYAPEGKYIMPTDKLNVRKSKEQ